MRAQERGTHAQLALRADGARHAQHAQLAFKFERVP